jgi:hypothetical protein
MSRNRPAQKIKRVFQFDSDSRSLRLAEASELLNHFAQAFNQTRAEIATNHQAE